MLPYCESTEAFFILEKERSPFYENQLTVSALLTLRITSVKTGFFEV